MSYNFFVHTFYGHKYLLYDYNWVGFVGECVGFADKECMVWYMLFIIFVPYAMLPLPLVYCMVGGTVSGVAHIIVMTIEKLQKTNVRHQFFSSIFIKDEYRWFCNICISLLFM